MYPFKSRWTDYRQRKRNLVRDLPSALKENEDKQQDDWVTSTPKKEQHSSPNHNKASSSCLQNLSSQFGPMCFEPVDFTVGVNESSRSGHDLGLNISQGEEEEKDVSQTPVLEADVDSDVMLPERSSSELVESPDMSFESDCQNKRSNALEHLKLGEEEMDDSQEPVLESDVENSFDVSLLEISSSKLMEHSPDKSLELDSQSRSSNGFDEHHEQVSDGAENSLDGDSDIDWHCRDADFRVAFLDEDEDVDDPEPQGEPQPEPHDPPYDSDPDNGSDDSNGNSSSGEDDDESDENDDNENFGEGPTLNFNNPYLNRRMNFGRNTTVKELLLMQLALSIANNWTYKSLLGTLRVLNRSIDNYFPTHMKSLWRLLMFNGNSIKCFGYCNRCMTYLGPREELPQNVHCENCDYQAPRRKVKWFISLSVKKQLEHILSLPGMAENLQYRNNRNKLNPDNMEDIFDGNAFRELQNVGGILHSALNFGYVFFTDGFKTGKNSRLEAWPILLRLVDLPPNLRQRHMILAGFWIDSTYPNMNTFLRPFVRQANHLSTVGVNWRPNGVNDVNSKLVPLCMCVDYKARPPILQQTQYNGAYGCFLCDNRGIYAAGSWRYPALPHPEVAPGVMRTDENVRRDMQTAHRTRRNVRGYYGRSRLLQLRHFRICTGNVIDNLHAVYERVVPVHTELLLRRGRMPIVQKERRINERLLQIRPPSSIARTPYDFRKRASYKANEWRNWLLLYSVPCLQELGIPQRYLDHWNMLSHGILLLSQDSISPADIDHAENLLNRYVELYEEYYGLGAMSPCVHLMSHLAAIVREWGPLWCYTTFNFESYIQKLLARITSPQGAVLQVVTRHLLEQCVLAAAHHQQDGISEEVREELLAILNKPRRQNVTEVDGVYMIGNGNVTFISPEEEQCLRQEGYMCEQYTEYNRVLLRAFQVHSLNYNQDRLHNDTRIYTTQDTFCVINKIVTFLHEGQDICGMFVNELNVDLPFHHARHIARALHDGHLLHFIRHNQVKNPAVRVEVLGVPYLVALPSNYEID